MKYIKLLITLCLLAILNISFCYADNFLYPKMHWPQDPDPYGWDVNGIIADDWRCSESGPVKGFVFWGSWYSDIYGNIENISIRVYSDISEEENSLEYSMPGDLLWECNIDNFEYIEEYDFGNQGWLEPEIYFDEENHNYYNKIEITEFGECPDFYQEKDNIYWIEFDPVWSDHETYSWGWKTTYNSQRFNDNAVYWNSNLGNWSEIIDPIDSDDLDLAFVVLGTDPFNGEDPSAIPEFSSFGTIAMILILSGAIIFYVWKKK